jgi:hypothetical protein
MRVATFAGWTTRDGTKFHVTPTLPRKRAAGESDPSGRLKMRETPSMVVQEFCRREDAAISAVSRGAAFVGPKALVKTLIPHPVIEHSCGLRGDESHKIRATGEDITQQDCAR